MFSKLAIANNMKSKEFLNIVHNEKQDSLKAVETPKDKEKTKSYIEKKLENALEKGAFGGISLLSLFLWLIDRGGKVAKKYAMSQIKGSLSHFKIEY